VSFVPQLYVIALYSSSCNVHQQVRREKLTEKYCCINWSLQQSQQL